MKSGKGALRWNVLDSDLMLTFIIAGGILFIRNGSIRRNTETRTIDEVECVLIQKKIEKVSTGPSGPKFKLWKAIFQDKLEIGRNGLLRMKGNDFVEFK